MSKILSFETSSEACSVSLLNGSHVFSLSESQPRQHAQKLLPMIRRLLSEHQIKLQELDAIAFGAGPGSFTGLRIATGVAQGLSYGSEVKALAVSSLEALAHHAANLAQTRYVLSLLDARMDEMYWCLYELDAQGCVRPLSAERVSKPEELCFPETSAQEIAERGVLAVGNGLGFLERFPGSVRDSISGQESEWATDAQMIALLAQQKLAQGADLLAPEYIQPRYVRNEVAWKKLPGK